MRLAILSMMVLILVLLLFFAWREPDPGSFDDRFERADQRLEAMMKEIDEDLEPRDKEPRANPTRPER